MKITLGESSWLARRDSREVARLAVSDVSTSDPMFREKFLMLDVFPQSDVQLPSETEIFEFEFLSEFCHKYDLVSISWSNLEQISSDWYFDCIT